MVTRTTVRFMNGDTHKALITISLPSPSRGALFKHKPLHHLVGEYNEFALLHKKEQRDLL